MLIKYLVKILSVYGYSFLNDKNISKIDLMNLTHDFYMIVKKIHSLSTLQEK